MWQPVGQPPKLDVMPLLVGSLEVTSIALLAAVPVALAPGVFVSDVARPSQRRVLEPALELLAGVPSVVPGLVALMLVAPAPQRALDLTYAANALVAGLALSLAVIPIVFSVAEDALSAVPRALREASDALGARRWQTALWVVLPAAAPGVVAGVVLGFGRAIGETMIVLMVSGNAAVVDAAPTSGARTVTATIAAELGETERGGDHWQTVRALAGVPSIVFGLFGLGFFVLFVGRGIDGLAYGELDTAVFGRPCMLWASATLAVLTLPVVVVTTEQALRAAPREPREAAAALRATKLQSIRTVVLPAARAGILTGAAASNMRTTPTPRTRSVGSGRRRAQSRSESFSYRVMQPVAAQANPARPRSRPSAQGELMFSVQAPVEPLKPSTRISTTSPAARLRTICDCVPTPLSSSQASCVAQSENSAITVS